MMHLSTIDLFGMKAVWFGWIILPNISLSHVESILVSTLYTILQSEIVQKCYTLVATCLFGMRAMKVWLIALLIFPWVKKSCIAKIILIPSVFQKVLKKIRVMSSGPGLLLLAIENNAFWILSEFGIATKLEFTVSDIVGLIKSYKSRGRTGLALEKRIEKKLTSIRLESIILECSQYTI